MDFSCFLSSPALWNSKPTWCLNPRRYLKLRGMIFLTNFSIRQSWGCTLGMLHVDFTYPGTMLLLLNFCRCSNLQNHHHLWSSKAQNHWWSKMVVKTRLSTARPNREQRLENAARRCRVKKSIEKAQQEEALKELLKIMANNGGKVPYGEVDKLVKKI